MAILHRAHLRPTKLELISDWLPNQPWFAGGPRPELTAVGAYRFDDPNGEVGIETHLVRADHDPILQVPLTYRDAPLAGCDQWLVGTMEHSVLGRRWVYDACADPVYATALAAVILGDGAQAEEFVEVQGRLEARPPTVRLIDKGSAVAVAPVVDAVEQLSCSTHGVQTVMTAPGLQLTLLRVVDPSVHTLDAYTLAGMWTDQEEPVVLATARLL